MAVPLILHLMHAGTKLWEWLSLGYDRPENTSAQARFPAEELTPGFKEFSQRFMKDSHEVALKVRYFPVTNKSNYACALSKLHHRYSYIYETCMSAAVLTSIDGISVLIRQPISCA